jgi:hypothetical protein
MSRTNGHAQPLVADAAVDLLRFARGRKFGTILADPPWRFTNKTGKVAPEHRRLSRYSTMKLEEIMALPVADLTRWPSLVSVIPRKWRGSAHLIGIAGTSPAMTCRSGAGRCRSMFRFGRPTSAQSRASGNPGFKMQRFAAPGPRFRGDERWLAIPRPKDLL